MRTAVPYLDRVIDINYYPIADGRGVQPALAPGRARRDGPAGRVLPAAAAVRLAPRRASCRTRIAEEIYFHALSASAELAERDGAHPAFAETRAARGELQFDLWGVTPDQTRRAGTRCATRIARHGLRNSLLIAIAPTATIASIAGCYECIEPQVSNLFKRETLSGEFLQVNRYLVARAEGARPVDRATRAARSSAAEGSVQGIAELPDDVRALFRTAWEIPHALADRHGRRPRRRSSTRASR